MVNFVKTKLKSNFKESIASDNKPKKKTDHRFLHYQDLPVNEKMKILFIPDENGELFKDWEVHGSNMKVRGAGTVRCCYESNGESCPACSVSYEYYQQGNKQENQRWIKNKRTVAQCIVVESPMEVQDNPDENLVYLMYVPQKVRKIVEEAVMEEIIDDPTQCLFVLKKTVNEGGYNNYESSYFIQKEYEPSDEIIEASENNLIRPYNFDEMEAEGDVIPKRTSSKEVQEWVDHVRSLETQINETRTQNASDDDDDDDDDQPPRNTKASDEPEEETKASGGTGESVRDKLNRFKKSQ